MQVKVVECPPDVDSAEIRRRAIASNPRRVGLASLQRKSPTQFESDFWLIRLYNNEANPTGHLSFQPSSPLVAYALEEFCEDTVFVIASIDFHEFEGMCRTHDIEIVRMDQ